jgi:putative two-component system response regulator
MEQDILKEQNTQLKNLLNGIVFVMADHVENRDNGAVGHIGRTSEYIKILLNVMKERGTYSAELAEINIDIMCSASRLHDVGKIVIPDIVLNKPGRLTDFEFDIMKAHAIEGERIIDQMTVHAGNNIEFLTHAKLFAGNHHERWDGMGYPRRLDRLNIPLQGRIMAIIDVYDALISERPYKQPFTPEEAVKIIMDSTGEMFDPLIAEAFYDVRQQFEALK